MLVLAARNRQSLTYGLFSKLISVPTVGLGHLLEPIQSCCLLQPRMPPLSAIVVSAETGLTGTGFVAAAALPREQMRVFGYDWFTIGCPTPEDFAMAVSTLPADGSKVRPRGGSSTRLEAVALTSAT